MEETEKDFELEELINQEGNREISNALKISKIFKKNLRQLEEISTSHEEPDEEAEPEEEQLDEEEIEEGPQEDEEDPDDFNDFFEFGGKRRRGDPKSSKKRRRTDNIPENLRSLIGEATKQYALLNFPRSIEICKEIIRQNPNIKDPYTILGNIYEDKGDLDRSIEFLILGALLSKKDDSRYTIWKRLADMAQRQNYFQQAVYCYTKMINLKPKECSEPLYFRSAIYRDHLDNHKKAMEGFLTLFEMYPGDARICEDLVLLYWEHDKIDEAIKALETYKKSSTNPEFKQMNHLAQCYMIQGQFLKVISLIKDISVIYNGYDSLPLELKIKHIISLAFTGEVSIAEELMDNLPNSNEIYQEYSEEYYEIADTWYKLGEYEKSLTIFEKLFELQISSQLKINIQERIGFCYYNLGQEEKAIETFESYLQISQNNEIKSKLIDLYKNKNIQKALTLVNQGDDTPLLVKKSYLYLENNNYPEFLNISLPIIENMVNFLSNKKKMNNSLDHYSSQLSKEDLFDLTFKVVKTLTLLNNFEKSFELLKVISYTTKKIFEPTKLLQIQDYYIRLLNLKKDYNGSCEIMRHILLENPYTDYWSLLHNFMYKSTTSTSDEKFIIRMLLKYPECTQLQILYGHLSSMRGSFRLALATYHKIYKEYKTDPIISLCIGINYLNLSLNRRCANRHAMIIKAFTFLLQYFDLSLENEESCFNLARAYQQIGLNHLSIFYYEKVINYGQNLTQEAAYNLYLIYKKSGNMILAKKMLNDYIVV